VLAAFANYGGADNVLQAHIEMLINDCDERRQCVVAEAAAVLANTLPNCGPVLALEILCALARLWAKGSSQ
jgi:hypothetical protein